MAPAWDAHDGTMSKADVLLAIYLGNDLLRAAHGLYHTGVMMMDSNSEKPLGD